MDQLISFREFARQLNVSEGTVRKAIKAGKITNASLDFTNPKRPKLHLENAKAEWKKNYSPDYTQSENLEAALHKKTEAQPIAELPEPQKNNSVTLIEKSILPFVENSKTVRYESTSPENLDEDNESIELSKFAETAEARRVEAIAKARTAQLEYNERKQRLVDKSNVYKELFAIGQAVRAALQGIPDKIIDNLLACDDRAEAHKLLYNEITEALEALNKKPKF